MVRDPTNTLVDRSKVSGKGFDGERRLFLILSKFGGFEHQGTKSLSSRRAGDSTGQESPEEVAVPTVQEALRRVRDTGTRASGKRTLSRGVEAARAAPHRT